MGFIRRFAEHPHPPPPLTVLALATSSQGDAAREACAARLDSVIERLRKLSAELDAHEHQ